MRFYVRKIYVIIRVMMVIVPSTCRLVWAAGASGQYWMLRMLRSKSSSKSKKRQPLQNMDNIHFMITGLGNHGMDMTRHNVGMMAVDHLALQLNGTWDRDSRKFGGSICKVTITQKEGHIVNLALFKPQAFMNINGQSVAKTAKILKVLPRNIFTLQDELDISQGKFQLKEKGSANGHKGVLSCMHYLNSKEVPRLRLGIGRPSHSELVSMYVLDTFTEEEMPLVKHGIEKGLQALLNHIRMKPVMQVEDNTTESETETESTYCGSDNISENQTFAKTSRISENSESVSVEDKTLDYSNANKTSSSDRDDSNSRPQSKLYELLSSKSKDSEDIDR